MGVTSGVRIEGILNKEEKKVWCGRSLAGDEGIELDGETLEDRFGEKECREIGGAVNESEIGRVVSYTENNPSILSLLLGREEEKSVWS